MKKTILKSYIGACALLATYLLFSNQNDALAVFAAVATLGLILVISIVSGDGATYTQGADGWAATLTKDGREYMINRNGTFVNIGGQFLPAPGTPSADVSEKIHRLNLDEKAHKSRIMQKIATIIALFLAFVYLCPTVFSSVLATPGTLYATELIWNILSYGLAILGIASAIAIVSHYVGGANIAVETGPFSVQISANGLPEIDIDASPDGIVLSRPGESPREYAARVVEAQKKNPENLAIIPRGNPVWAIQQGDTTICIDRTEGSEQLGIPPVVEPAVESSADYKKSAATFIGSFFRFAGTTQKRLAADDINGDGDVVANIINRMGSSILLLLLWSLPSFMYAKDNNAQAEQYLGINYTTVKPIGNVCFVFSRLTIRVAGDGQKTFSALLTHSTGFDDAAEWGKLSVITVNDLPIAKASAPIAQTGGGNNTVIKTEPYTGPKSLFVEAPPSAGSDLKQSVMAYFSKEATDRRLKNRDVALQSFSENCSSNVRREFLSLALIPIRFFFWLFAIIGGILWAISYISAKESAIHSNGMPIFGKIQNWIHSLSAGALYLIAIFSVSVYLIYTTLAWILPIEHPVVCIILFCCNLYISSRIAHKIIPNKRVRTASHAPQLPSGRPPYHES